MNYTFWNYDNEYYLIDEMEVNDMHKCIWRLVCNSSWLGFFSICLILFLLLSTEKQRKSILFPFQCCFFILIISYNSSAIYNSDHRFKTAWILDGAEKQYWSFAKIDVANLSLEHWITLLADGSVLIFILETYFPSCSFSKQQRFKYGLPFLCLIFARIGLIIANTNYTWLSQSNIQWIDQRSIPIQFGTRFLQSMKGTGKADYLLGATYEIMICSFLIRQTIKIAKERSENLEKDLPTELSRIQKSFHLIFQLILMCYTIPLAFRFTIVPLLNCLPGYCYDREISLTIANTSAISSILATSWSTVKPIPTKDQIERDQVRAYDDRQPAYKSLVFSNEQQQAVSDPNTLVN